MAKNRQFIRNSGENKGYRGSGQTNDENQPIEEGEETLVDIVEVKEHAQDYFEKNQNLVLGVLVIAILALGGYLGYKYGYKAPRQKAGMEAMYKAQYQFERDSFALALTNPGEGFEGFLDIADNYSGTKAGNLANYYSGISYLNLGNYDAAIEYLEDYTAHDDITPITKAGAIGDAYAEKGDLDKAASYYKKAADSNNEFLTPYYLNKLAVLSMKNGDNETALAQYEKIAADFPQSNEAKEANKYITILKKS